MFNNGVENLVILEYIYIFKYIFVALGISSLLFVLSTLFVYQKPEREKMSVYECGFNPYGDARSKFEVKYYIVGILFIIFDLEISYLFPWIIGWWNLHIIGIYVMYLFLALLTVGFIYELSLGVIDLNFIFFINKNLRFKLGFYFILFILFIFVNVVLYFLLMHPWCMSKFAYLVF